MYLNYIRNTIIGGKFMGLTLTLDVFKYVLQKGQDIWDLD